MHAEGGQQAPCLCGNPRVEKFASEGGGLELPRETGSQATPTGKCEFRYSKVDLEVWNFVALWPFGEGEL